MESRYSPADLEKKWYQYWEDGGYFQPKQDPDAQPFTIVLPPPNANAALHLGHAMYVVEDIMVRYHRMKGDRTLWLPGADHAGFETQVVYERMLNKEGKSRFDFDRDTLYGAIYDFVLTNRTTMQDQLRRLGFSLDWTRDTFTLDDQIVATVYDTFQQLHADGLLYRGSRMVNYCTKDGTSFSDLEINHDERTDPLYYLKYTNSTDTIVVATVRPETIFGDVAIAVHPDGTRYGHLVGRTITFNGLIGPIDLQIIADPEVDPEFGTGAVKVTPAHDPNDYAMAQRHGLPLVQVIELNGRLNDKTGPYAGLKVLPARERVVADLQAAGLIDHVDTKYVHAIATCYKCNTAIEPMILPNWFVKTKDLATKAADKLRDGSVTIIPERPYTKLATDWFDGIIDWNISRQIVFGIRIPVWYDTDKVELNLTFLPQGADKPVTGNITDLLTDYSLDDIKAGLQVLRAPQDADYTINLQGPPGDHYLQETDVFDTWFSSSQWPYATLGYPDQQDFKHFYPTQVMETGADILRFWVCRMLMMGLYRADDIPFKQVYLHGLVVDKDGQKMSKSKGNVINPMEQVDKYGADALRFALIYGGAAGSNIAYSEDKTKGMRNFATKIWNIARFLSLNLTEGQTPTRGALADDDTAILAKLTTLTTDVTTHVDRSRFADATALLYDFLWHDVADIYLEAIKPRLASDDLTDRDTARAVLLQVLTTSLTLLHPFMPFVTEEINENLHTHLHGDAPYQPLIVTPWPQSHDATAPQG